MLSREEKEVFQEAGFPTDGIIENDFIFRFKYKGHTDYWLRGFVGSTVVRKGGGEKHSGDWLVITPSTPFPEMNFGLIRYFAYDVKNKEWHAAGEPKLWIKGVLTFE